MARTTAIAQGVVLAVGSALAGAYVLLPHTATRELVLYDGAVALALAAAAVGTRRVPAGRRAPWLLTTLGLASFLIGELLWWWFAQRGVDQFPSLADGFYLMAYVPLGLGAAALASGRRADRDRFAWLDAGLLTVVLGVFVWTFLMDPYVNDPTLGWSTKAVTLGYPLADLFVLGFTLRLLLTRSTQTRATRLFSAGTLAMLVADLWFGAQELGAGYEAGTPIDALFVLAYLGLGLAALDHSAGHERRVDPGVGLGRGRLAVVLLAVGLPQAVLLHALHGAGLLGASIATVAAVGGLVATLLVGLRLWALLGTVRQVESRRGAERLAAIVDHSSDAILLLAVDGGVRYATPAVASEWGRFHDDVRSARLTDWVLAADRAGLAVQLSTVALGGLGALVEVRFRVTTGSGTVRSVEGSLRNLLDDTTVGAIVATLRDVTSRNELEDQLRRKAFHDDLTGLANRALFADRLAHALERKRRDEACDVAVLFVDLDGFKAVNDGLGHAAGDELLQHVAERISTCVRPADTVARLGGDEFAILLEEVASMDEAVTVAERILEVLALPVQVLDGDITVPASVGVAPWSPGITAEALLRNADIAMYSAKAYGKGRIEVFDDALRLVAERNLSLRIDLPGALASQQLRVVYQPIHHVRDGVLTGFEALVRWDHPVHGGIAPGEFIAVAEESGFIVDLGRWVLHRACEQAAIWNARSETPLTMNVNVSTVQLHHELPVDVAAALRSSGLDPALLTIELTESVLLDRDRVGGTLEEIRELGVGIAIDDFGTGYSSLAYLQQLPISAVKIDRSFVSRLVEQGDASLIRTILDMADALGLKSVAEGVESAAELEALDALQCSHAQGYHLGYPQEVEEVDALVGGARSDSTISG